ncbi:MAG: GNAT family N-acetyltransferase [Betaproteobacteria bacterium]|nr:GNAT family N-acetyltransferase [Betaproteobacteria bacterium]
MLTTERLLLRPFTTNDTAFILELLNDPDWIRNIGDRNVRTPEDAQRYLENGPIKMMAAVGHSLMMVAEKHGNDVGAPVGMCGLIKREGLDDVDIGYAFLPVARGKGYAREAAAAVLKHGRQVLGIKRIVAITLPANTASVGVAEAIGMRFEKVVQLPKGTEDLALYVSQ